MSVIANCPRCQRVFRRTAMIYCPECLAEQKLSFEQVHRYLDTVPEAFLDDIAKHCKLPVKELEEWFFSGMLGTDTRKIRYVCQGCQTPLIASNLHGRFCVLCSAKLEPSPERIAEKQAADKAEKAEKAFKVAKALMDSLENQPPPTEASSPYDDKHYGFISKRSNKSR